MQIIVKTTKIFLMIIVKMKIIVFSYIVFEIYLGPHSRDHNRVSTVNLLIIKLLPNELSM